jgi:hypothetical protein
MDTKYQVFNCKCKRALDICSIKRSGGTRYMHARQQGKYQWIASVYLVSPDSETQRGSGKDIRLAVRLSFDAGGGPQSSER